MGFWDAVASAGPHANNLHLAPDRQPHQHLISQFLQARCSSWRPANSVKALNATFWLVLNEIVKKWSICVSLYHERFFSGALWKNTFSPHVRFWVEKALSRCRARQPNLWLVSMLILCDILVDWWLPSSVVLGFCASSLTGFSCHLAGNQTTYRLIHYLFCIAQFTAIFKFLLMAKVLFICTWLKLGKWVSNSLVQVYLENGCWTDKIVCEVITETDVVCS